MFRRAVLKKLSAIAAGVTLTAAASTTVFAQDTIRVAYIDPLSGPFANVGDAGAKHFLYVAEMINENGGIMGKDIEIIPFDNKSSPQESLQILQKVADQGIQYITQGNGSHVAGALIQGVEKHNARNPDNQILFLNYAAVNPDFTNEDCSFWHFRFDANAAMKLQAITDVIKENPETKKLFLINQDYSHGQAVSRITKNFLARKRPDIEIVGDVLHPIGKVKDFSPYISQIQSSGADTVVTGNWGNDLSLLVKAGSDAGLDVTYHTFYAGGLGTPTAIGESGVGKVTQVTEWFENLAVRENAKELEDILVEFEERYPEIEFYYLRVLRQMQMLKMAVEEAGSTNPKDVAYAMEGMNMDSPFGPVTMRTLDHQVIQPLYISVFSDDYLKYDTEDTGFGWKYVAKINAEDTAVPSTCEMQRP
ncbi:branched-chain amino acid ABC transporter substrate-binding protein [Ectothiorhodospiraceae bacterium WFHF3C12]|nr:branched-chain amino acid ABC transporter substrate-binding protein [Ectothiorhodospiraceae bacterium WFHF3C12]